MRTPHRAGSWRTTPISAGAGFPEHGLVVCRSADDARGMRQGITAEADLADAVVRLLRRPFVRRVFLEPDLRAHVNPTRIETIADAPHDLVANAQRRCPACDRPGFAIGESKPGLPGAWCDPPTNARLAHVHRGRMCEDADVKRYPYGEATADPGPCSF